MKTQGQSRVLMSGDAQKADGLTGMPWIFIVLRDTRRKYQVV